MLKNRKLGFTLIELLVVVIIVILVVAFAIPSFKKTQANSKNQRAQAVLIDIAGAVKNFRVYEDTSASGGVHASGQITEASTFTSGGALYHLFSDNLLKPIGWDDSTGTTYNGYKFWVCSGATTDPACCNAAPVGSPAVAAMENSVSGGRFGSGACAWVDEQGNLGSTYDSTVAI